MKPKFKHATKTLLLKIEAHNLLLGFAGTRFLYNISAKLLEGVETNLLEHISSIIGKSIHVILLLFLFASMVLRVIATTILSFILIFFTSKFFVIYGTLDTNLWLSCFTLFTDCFFD